MFEIFSISLVTVFLAEMGDKTQLLALLLAARFRQKYAIIAGIAVATTMNHFVSAWLGVWLRQFLQSDWIPIIVAVSFILVGLWILIPDKEEGANKRYLKWGAFFATFVLFFVAEIGDKTQLATIFLALHYENLIIVMLGSTIGLMLANVPVVFLGEKFLAKVPLDLVRYVACAVFIIIGLVTLIFK